MPEEKEKKLKYGKSWQKHVADKFADEESLGVIRGHRYFQKKVDAETDPKKKNLLKKLWASIKSRFVDKEEDERE